MLSKQSTTISKFSTQSELSDNSLRLFLDSKLKEYEDEKAKLENMITQAEAEAIELDELTLGHGITLCNIELTSKILSDKKAAYQKAVDFYQSTL
jgi:hypothetical protein